MFDDVLIETLALGQAARMENESAAGKVLAWVLRSFLELMQITPLTERWLTDLPPTEPHTSRRGWLARRSGTLKGHVHQANPNVFKCYYCSLCISGVSQQFVWMLLILLLQWWLTPYMNYCLLFSRHVLFSFCHIWLQSSNCGMSLIGHMAS